MHRRTAGGSPAARPVWWFTSRATLFGGGGSPPPKCFRARHFGRAHRQCALRNGSVAQHSPDAMIRRPAQLSVVDSHRSAPHTVEQRRQPVGQGGRARPTPGSRTMTMDATSQRYLMCRPDVLRRRLRDQPVDGPDRAGRRRPAPSAQWEQPARDLPRRSATPSSVIDPVPGLPDMVFAANGAHRGRRHGATARSSATRERAAEAPAYLDWFARRRLRRCTRPKHVNEGEGDFLLAGDFVLAGTGFRTDARRARRGCRSSSAARWSRCSWSTRASTTWTPR